MVPFQHLCAPPETYRQWEPHACCAAIVEPRRHRALRLAVRSVRLTLGPETEIFVFHGEGEENRQYAATQTQNLGPVRLLELRCSNLDAYEYSVLLASPHFYGYFPSEYVLIFQTDVLLFPYSPYRVTDFYGYDWVGAPWAWSYGRKGNGGLSLRRVPTLREALSLEPYPHHLRLNEDLFISQLNGVSVAPPELGRQFSVESLFHPTPFGVHKFWAHLTPEQQRRLAQYAPCVIELLRLNERVLP